jgi:hypothetical protein
MLWEEYVHRTLRALLNPIRDIRIALRIAAAFENACGGRVHQSCDHRIQSIF